MDDHQQAIKKAIPGEACIPSNYSRLIARMLGLNARELPSFLTQTGLSVVELMRDEVRLTSTQQIQILQNALRLSDDEMFGLRLGQSLTPPTHGAMGFMVSSSPNLLVALRAFQTYLPTRIDFLHLELKLNKKYWECSCYFDLDVNDEIQRLIVEAIASIILQCAEFVIGTPVEEAYICFPHTEPSYSKRYSEFLPGSIEFSSTHLTLKLPANLCDIPNASANHESYSLAMQQCQSMLEKLPGCSSNCTQNIQKMMLSHPPGVLSEEAAAAMLFISKRTLARRLKLEGNSFQKIRDEIMSQQASSYLRDSDMSVNTIAALLNYHDGSSFRRTFKRWFKMSPDQYRKQPLGY
jgi:AraC-like DNA-binding protein